MEEQKEKFRIFVFSKTGDFRHKSIESGIRAIYQLGEKYGFRVDSTEDAAMFNDGDLHSCHAVVFLNTSGDVLNENEQAAFMRYIQNGGGFAGIHGATDTEYDWPWYQGLVGTSFDEHPEIQEAVIKVLDRSHPSTHHLSDLWVRSDEWYNFRSNLSDDIYVLAKIDESSYSGGTHGTDHPFSWCQEYDGGRSWYSAGGHTEESYSDNLFLKHLLGGIRYAAGVPEGFYPRTLLIDLFELDKNKDRLAQGSMSLHQVLDRLNLAAEKAMKSGPFSVTYKKARAPSGDVHDYMSMGPYWWPNPKTKDGLPYIRKDGKVNPARNQYDKVPLRTLEECVKTLALAFYYTNNKKYAERAAQLIRVWFLDDSTRMNPNLNFGQFIPGKSQGRSVGIIETRSIFKIVEALGLIFDSAIWTIDDHNQLKSWLKEYLSWLLNSDLGIEEAARKNNHGTWYDVQVAYLALYTGQKKIAKEILDAFSEKRIAVQVNPDGQQPFELERTKAFSYSLLNLEGYFSAAMLGEKVGCDLWSYSTEDNRSLKSALDYLIPYVFEDKKWPHEQLGGWEKAYPRLSALMKVAMQKFKNTSYDKMIQKYQTDKNKPADENSLSPWGI